MPIITGTPSSDTVNATTVSAGVVGGPATIGDDIIYGLGGFDNLYGGSGNDLIDGGAGTDSLYGEFGDDTLLGGDGWDNLTGGPGNDRLEGGADDDYLSDSEGVNVLLGGDGNDTLFGAGTLDGGAGDDQITASIMFVAPGGAAPVATVMTGGIGRDTFAVNSAPFSGSLYTVPVITDFTVGASGDRFDLSSWLRFAPSYNGQSPFTAGYVGFRQSGADTIVLWDSTGGGDDYIDAVRLAGVLSSSLTAENFNPGYSPSDAVPQVTTISFAGSIAPALYERSSGSVPVTFTATRKGDLSETHSVSWSVAGSGANPATASDFLDGVLPSGTLIFAAGETSKTITINVAGDTTVETDEGFVVSLSAPTGNVVIRSGVVAATIFNDDWAPSVVTRFHSGGAGYDTFDLTSVGRRAGSFAQEADGDLTFSRTGSVDTYRNIEVINFADGRMVLDLADPAAQVIRLYQAGLGRGADQGGLNFWIDAVSNGTPLSQLSSSFLNSQEFASRYGRNSSAEDYVNLLYNNALGRSADSAGKAYWVNLLDNGIMNSAEVLVAFSESAENTARTAGVVQAGIWDISEHAAQVARLYDTALGRLPDVSGLTFWRAAIDRGTASLSDLADAFVSSREFQATYGALSNRGFVERVYQNTLDRAGDTDGVNFWTASLDAGAARRDVLISFSESVEHQSLTAPNIMNENPGQYGILFAG